MGLMQPCIAIVSRKARAPRGPKTDFMNDIADLPYSPQVRLGRTVAWYRFTQPVASCRREMAAIG